jgi:hypothetical protein
MPVFSTILRWEVSDTMGDTMMVCLWEFAKIPASSFARPAGCRPEDPVAHQHPAMHARCCSLRRVERKVRGAIPHPHDSSAGLSFIHHGGNIRPASRFQLGDRDKIEC